MMDWKIGLPEVLGLLLTMVLAGWKFHRGTMASIDARFNKLSEQAMENHEQIEQRLIKVETMEVKLAVALTNLTDMSLEIKNIQASAHALREGPLTTIVTQMESLKTSMQHLAEGQRELREEFKHSRG